ncbi:hypothetical protein [Dubosiella muris]|uniref:Uncharacterized protein n=1 Tax=Dubosiella muris TaxID=3038133 RepID=A0AC61R798_9FIRM|nr:hypothetical protein [Dubosiella muris]TGY65444.1 hypothetical protein E5336_08480 [Dubosiella muris]
MSATKIPEWVLHCLDQYGNCACGRAITKKFGKDKLLEVLEAAGYPCELEILSDQKDKNQYPKDGTYIVTLKNRQTLFESM